MTFWNIFFRLLPRRPRGALEALYWHITRRKVRARNRLLRATLDLPFAYDIWMSTAEGTTHHAPGLQADFDSWDWRPRFSIMIVASSESSEEQFARSRSSVEGQSYPFWKIVTAAPTELTATIAAMDDDYVVPLRAGDALADSALFRFAERLQVDPSAAILYGDQDEIDDRGRRVRPWFKPQWNEEMFLAQDYLCRCVAIETGIAKEAIGTGAADELSGLLLAATSMAGGRVAHVPYVLCHVDPASGESQQEPRLAAVARHVQPLGATCEPGPFETVKVTWPLPTELPLVSIIIPTRDQVELLRACVESLLERTMYGPFEVLIVDNGSVEPKSLTYLSELTSNPLVRVLRNDRPYNFSALNNFAAREARGAYLCLLNNDTEIVTPGWLTEMMRYAVRPEVGAVGAKLLYDDGSIQHAGVVIGLGGAAGHAHRFLKSGDPGYFRRAHVAHFVSAVTAACLVVDRGKFDRVGGLDEQDLSVAFNDVDFCLKLQTAGWRNVYVPHAVLLHHESKSRGSDAAPENRERYSRELRILQERWLTAAYEDPLHSPNLDRGSETYVVRI